MSLEAEALLIATGLLETPERQHVSASAEMLAGLRRGLVQALSLEEPLKLKAYPERKRYWDRLSEEPDYAELNEAATRLIGADDGDLYVAAHMRARKMLMDLRPRKTITTVMGPRPMPLDDISQGRWDLAVDTVESARIVADLASGALIKQTVDIFQAAFPTIYADLIEAEFLETTRLAGESGMDWEPEPWLARGLLLLEGKKTGSKIQAAEGTPPEKSKPTKSTPTKEIKISKVIDDLAVSSQKTQ